MGFEDKNPKSSDLAPEGKRIFSAQPSLPLAGFASRTVKRKAVGRLVLGPRQNRGRPRR